MLTSSDRRRLIGVLKLLASSSAGERDAAALAAVRIVSATGLSWAEIIAEPEAEPYDEDASGEDGRALAAMLLRWHAAAFNAVELDFLYNAASLHQLTPRQAQWLRRLVKKVRGSAQAA